MPRGKVSTSNSRALTNPFRAGTKLGNACYLPQLSLTRPMSKHPPCDLLRLGSGRLIRENATVNQTAALLIEQRSQQAPTAIRGCAPRLEPGTSNGFRERHLSRWLRFQGITLPRRHHLGARDVRWCYPVTLLSQRNRKAPGDLWSEK